ncbi:S24 family peptidase [Citrobacter braakii]|jgi:phage repressor protein C with HTH and peptisase S24 domain|nr:S24 family peptidase [Citrobacter braakii]ELK6840366.1 S24 family peptidase [Citrobacter braakii]
MQILPYQSKGVFDVQVAYFHKATEQFGARVKTCQMDGDSMQPTIEPYQIVAVADFGNEIKTEGIYAYSCFFWGKECLFIKRVIPLGGGALRIIHDNPHYLAFDLSPEEASQLTIHGKVVASMKVQRFA